MQKYLEEYLPKYLEVMQKRVIANGESKYIVGDKISIADIHIAGFIYSYLLNEDCYLSKA